MKIFSEEIKKFHTKLLNGEKFAFSKYADGEWLALNNVQCSSGNGEWTIDKKAARSVDLLRESYQYNDPGYYVGISCPCCQGMETHRKMKLASMQDEEHLTFANLFVNSNYMYFLENFIPIFKQHTVVLVANEKSVEGDYKLNNLPFAVTDFYGVRYNAWVDDLDWAVDAVSKTNFENRIVLFSCGPLGNILAHQLWKENKTNTYIDVGSTLDKWLENDIHNKRLYTKDGVSLATRTCVWGE